MSDRDGKMVVGFVGLGQMGRPIAEHIMRSGRECVLFDVNKDTTADFSGRGTVAESIAELVDGSDIVVGCLSTLDAHEEVLLGAAGLVQGGRARIYLHLGTTGAVFARRAAHELAKASIAFVDAPVTGGVRGARAGALVSIVSGLSSAVERARPVIECYSSRLLRFGEAPGAAQIVKLINNMLSNANLALASEALVFGAKAGLDPENVLELVNSGTGQNFATSVLIPEHVLPRSFASGGALSIVLKDLGILMKEAETLAVPLPLTEAAYRQFRETADRYGEREDWTQVARYVEEQAGHAMPKTRDAAVP